MAHKKKNLIKAISFLIFTGFLITTFASYFTSRELLRSQVSLNDLPLTSDNIYSEIQRDLLHPIFISSLMATDTFLRDWVIEGEQNVDQVTRYLNEIQKKYGTITSFFVSERTRTYYHSGGIMKKVSETEERDIWYFRVRDMKEDYEINVDPDMGNKDTVTIFINYRVYDYNGNYIGATGVGLAVHSVKKFIASYQEKFNRRIFFIDSEGEIKLEGLQSSPTIKNISQVEGLGSLFERIKSNGENYFLYKKEGQMTHLNTRYIDEFGWYLFVEQPEGNVLKQISRTLLVNLAVCIVITLIVLVLTSLTIAAYQKKIETLKGIVPICSFCKQIRDDKGFWNQVEAYVSKHTEAEFSHGVCPDCRKKHYPEVVSKRKDS